MLVPMFALFLPLLQAQEQILSPPFQEKFEFWLDVTNKMTMTDYYDSKEPSRPDILLYDVPSRQFLVRHRKVSRKCGAFINRTLSADALQTVVTADGLHKPIIAVNGSLPGPALVVYEGSQVVVHVTNRLFFESITIHWHGLPMTNNFWNDGVGRVSGFPIVPGQTYTYRFNAELAGTFFYHGHYGPDRGDGLFGPFVVLPRNQYGAPAEFIMTLSDWFHQSTKEQSLRNHWHFLKYPKGYENTKSCYAMTRSFDGSKVGIYPFHALLMNGRGWWSIEDILRQPKNLPLTKYPVEKDQTYRFRVINAATLYPIMVSFEGHKFTVIASDGMAVTNAEADFLIVNPGERFDILLKTTQNPTKSDYYIYIRTTEYYDDDFNNIWNRPHGTLGFLQFLNQADQPLVDAPDFGFSRCTPSQPCKVANCPFLTLGPQRNADCILLQQMTNEVRFLMDRNPLNGQLFERLLNINEQTGIDGYSFQYPFAPPGLVEDYRQLISPCTPDCFNNENCQCTHFQSLQLGSTVQLVLMNTRNKLNQKSGGYLHPIHIHGHHVFVTKIGYPLYNEGGKIVKVSPDISCTGKRTGCTWANASWANGNIPGQNLLNPPLKDTIAVPLGGYAVLRFRANNPGWWPMHCHLMPHHLNGMAMLLKTGEFRDLPPRPAEVTERVMGGHKVLDCQPKVPTSLIVSGSQSAEVEPFWEIFNLRSGESRRKKQRSKHSDGD